GGAGWLSWVPPHAASAAHAPARRRRPTTGRARRRGRGRKVPRRLLFRRALSRAAYQPSEAAKKGGGEDGGSWVRREASEARRASPGGPSEAPPFSAASEKLDATARSRHALQGHAAWCPSRDQGSGPPPRGAARLRGGSTARATGRAAAPRSPDRER